MPLRSRLIDLQILQTIVVKVLAFLNKGRKASN
jgi:hypothetical protein